MHAQLGPGRDLAPWGKVRKREASGLVIKEIGTNYGFIICTNYGFIIYTQVRMTKLLVMLSVAVTRIRYIQITASL